MDIKKIALFAAGTLFGSAGFKLLSSKDAKKVYTQTTAAVLRMKDSTMETVSKVQELSLIHILSTGVLLSTLYPFRVSSSRSRASVTGLQLT